MEPPAVSSPLLALPGGDFTLVDLSDRLSNATADAEPNPHHIRYRDHEETAQALEPVLGVPADLWPQGRFAAVESVELSTHSGTHVDAPYHYWPESMGAPARRIDEIPLRWCCGRGVRLDFRGRPDGAGITAADVDEALAAAGHELAPLDAVLIWTGASAGFGEPGYEHRQPGLRRDAVARLAEAGVRLIGIDAWGLDRPFDVMAAEARAGDTEQLWEAHRYGIEQEYCHIEKLAGLDQLPAATGFWVLAFPVRLADASAAWARVVALVPAA